MNKQQIYGKRYQGYDEVKQAYETQRQQFNDWALTRTLVHINNAQIILAKYNRHRDTKIETPALPWLSHRLTFKEFAPQGLVFTYTVRETIPGSWDKTPKNVEKNFIFPTEWLSLSVWDFNSRVRTDVKAAVAKDRARRSREAFTEKEKHIRQLRTQIENQIKELEKTRKQVSNDEEELKKLALR